MLSKKQFFSIVMVFLFAFASEALGMKLQPTYSIGRQRLNAKAIQEIERIIGYSFNNKALLCQAFTTRAANQQINSERLEYLGDSILESIVITLLYNKYPKAQEGQLTSARCALVSKEPLAALCQRLGLQKYIQFKDNQVLIDKLEDVIEALIGAIYLDGEALAAQEFVLRFFTPMLRTDGCPLDMEKTIESYARDSRKQITFTWDTTKNSYNSTESSGNGKVIFRKNNRLSASQQRIALYCARYEFINQLAPKYRNNLVCLALDPEYNPLPAQEEPSIVTLSPKQNSNITQELVAPIAASNPIAKDKEEEEIIVTTRKMIEVPVATETQTIPFILNWAEKIRENYRIRLHDISQKLYEQGVQYDCQQDDESDSWSCTLQYDDLNPIITNGLTKGEAQEKAACIAYGEIQRLIMLKGDICAGSLLNSDTHDTVSELNLFCQNQGLEIPQYSNYFKGKNNSIHAYSHICAPWLRFDIRGRTLPTVSEAKASAAKRVIALITHVSTHCFEPNKLYKLWRLQEAMLPRKNPYGCLIDICRTTNVVEPSISTCICEGPVAQGFKFQSTISIPLNQLSTKLITGPQESSKQLAEESAAKKALNQVANKIIRNEVLKDESNEPNTKKK